MSYFKPIYPEESNETVKGKLFSSEELKEWKSYQNITGVDSSIKKEVVKLDKVFKNEFSFNSLICKERGDEAEKIFVEACLKQGWIQKYVEDIASMDYIDHVDFIMKITDSTEIWVDVKCCRSLRRGWSEQSEYMFVELNNSGWLFGGKNNIIAQKMNSTDFCLFDKVLLQEYVKNVVDTNKNLVPYPEQSFNRVYCRESKRNGYSIKHFLSLISTKDAYKHCGVKIISTEGTFV